jgi:hypothetical protein
VAVPVHQNVAAREREDAHQDAPAVDVLSTRPFLHFMLHARILSERRENASASNPVACGSVGCCGEGAPIKFLGGGVRANERRGVATFPRTADWSFDGLGGGHGDMTRWLLMTSSTLRDTSFQLESDDEGASAEEPHFIDETAFDLSEQPSE